MNPEKPEYNPEEKDDRPITNPREKQIFVLEIDRQRIEKRMTRGETDTILPLARVALDREIDLRNQLLRERDEFTRRELENELESHLRQAESVMHEYDFYEVMAEAGDMDELLRHSDSPDFMERLRKHCDFYYGRDWLPVESGVPLYLKVGKREDIKPFIKKDALDLSEVLTEFGLNTDQAEEFLAWLME